MKVESRAKDRSKATSDEGTDMRVKEPRSEKETRKKGKRECTKE